MNTLGSWVWAQNSGGTIDEADHVELGKRIGALFEAAARPAPETPLAFGISDAPVPDSALCAEATALWQDVAPGWLAGHGYRTWYFARALGELDRLVVDHELLYVACLLHDLGLTEHAPPTPTKPCFAVTGGEAAAVVVEPHRSRGDAELVGEAIAMHLNIDIPLSDGVLSYLVAAGTLIDVTGPRLQLMPPSLLDAVNARHPRGEFGPAVGDKLAAIGAAFPATRAGYMHEVLDIGQLCRQHPLDLG